MPESVNEEAIKTEIELMEKEIIYFTGRRRLRARKKYLQLLHACGRKCLLDEPVYIDRI